MKPKAQVLDGLLRLRYALPYRINTSKVYPLLAPNGSTVIICGHDQGILIIWRGGRPFKPELQINSEVQNLKRVNRRDENPTDVDEDISGSATDASVIDLSLFEDEEEEVTPAKPYHPIVQDLNLPLGTATLHIAFPRIAYTPQILPYDMSPRMLGQDIVVAVACSDSITRLLTLPLMPPSPHAKKRPGIHDGILIGNEGRSYWGERLVKIPRAAGLQGLPTAISIAFMPRTTPREAEDRVEDGADETIDRDEGGSDVVDEEWDILLASCGSGPSGEVLMYKIPLSDDGTRIESELPDDNLLWRREAVVRSVAALDIYVPDSSKFHDGPYLLLAETNGPVRVYDCCLSSDKNRGQWIRWFFPGFEDNTQGDVRYRSLLDAKWILGGRAIAALTGDGEWGAWNTYLNTRIKTGQSEKRSSISSIVPTSFTISGWVGGLLSGNNSAKSSTGKVDSRSNLAPMTPSTRKIRESALFTGVNTRSSISSQGGISTCVIAKALSGKEEDETLVIWHGDRIVMIPSIITHWASKTGGSGNLFSSGAIGQAREVSAVDVGGELRNTVSILPLQVGHLPLQRQVKQPDLLVSGDRSLLILANPLRATGALGNYPRKAPNSLAGQRRLSRGELDVNDMDRILDSMEVSHFVNGDQSQADTVKRKAVFV
ncbi:hypothetical protein MMC11_006087 [Xylographa trunciseda]|nr:hypothetical protein [Xylographa trunciseda]